MGCFGKTRCIPLDLSLAGDKMILDTVFSEFQCTECLNAFCVCEEAQIAQVISNDEILVLNFSMRVVCSGIVQLRRAPREP